jgi:MoxR-like ATPase
MLEAMQERSVSIGGQTYKLPDIFVVVATQNPIEQEGTYELSEAQLDRFLLKEVITYPDKAQEIEILNRIEKDIYTAGGAVATMEDVLFLQQLCKKVYIAPTIKQYIVDIVQASRHPKAFIQPELASYVAMGASTRAAIAFMETAKAMALIGGRGYATPDDVKALRYEVLRHRIMLNFAAVADGVSEETIIDAFVGAINTP